MTKPYCSRLKKNTMFSCNNKDFLLNSIKVFLRSLKDYYLIIYLFDNKDLQSQITLLYNNYANPP